MSDHSWAEVRCQERGHSMRVPEPNTASGDLPVHIIESVRSAIHRGDRTYKRVYVEVSEDNPNNATLITDIATRHECSVRPPAEFYDGCGSVLVTRWSVMIFASGQYVAGRAHIERVPFVLTSQTQQGER